MWLSSISKRTPKAYFFYAFFGTVLLLVPVATTFFAERDLSSLRLTDASFLLPALIVLLLSVVCNRIYVLSDVFERNTLWPGHAFLLLSITVGMNADWMGIIIHGLASILIVNELLNVQYNRDARMHAFNIAFSIGIASFFESSLIMMTPFLLLGLRTLKPLNLKEYVIYLLGLACPYYFLWAYSFLSGDYTHWSGIFPVQSWFHFPAGLEWFTWTRWALAIFIVMVAIGLLSVHYNSLGVRHRRLSTAIVYLQIGAAATLIAGGDQPVIIFYMATAFAFPATLLMLRYSNKPYLELMHIIFVGIILAALLAGNI